MIHHDDRDRLLRFVSTLARPNAPRRDGDSLDLDSLALLQLVTYLEQNYSIRLAEHHVDPDDLRSVDGVLSVIERFA